MTDKGDPRAMRHLRPSHMPPSTPAADQGYPEGLKDIVHTVDDDALDAAGEAAFIDHVYQQLQALRAPFPPEDVEKLPKPMWKGAWKDENGRDLRKGKCEECGGYHVLANTIHLDYIGHAGVTKRLLEVDPMWEWEPVAIDANGLPAFDRFGGLWIKLTVCGVTRYGYGDAVGKDAGTTAVKEIIGDAIRNAAMRFGVALDLWSKLDRHENKNPGATSQASGQQRRAANRPSGQDGDGSQRRDGRGRQDRQAGRQAAPPRAANQDALDSLTSVCNEYGYSTQYCIDRWAQEHDSEHIERGDAAEITRFAAKLIEEATPEPDPETDTGPDGVGEDAAAGAADGTQAAEPVADGGHDPTDTSDVEKRPEELF